MSLVVPAEKTDAVHADTDRVERILVVDDDVRLRTLLQRFLEDKGFVVKTAHDATQMDRLLQRELFSLIVLDFMLPVEDGLSICRRLRQSNIDTPIIMLTARGSDSDRIAGLEAGADDYLPKPFNPNELLARIRAVLRRQVREVPGAPSQQMEVVSFGPWSLDLSTRTLTREGHTLTGKSVKMTLGTRQGEISDPVFVMAGERARGDARKLLLEGPDRYALSDGRFTTCPSAMMIGISIPAA